MAAKKTTAKTTIDALLDVMRKAPTKTHKVADLIAATKRPGPTVYSVIYSEVKKPHPRVRQTGKGTFALTSAGKEST